MTTTGLCATLTSPAFLDLLADAGITALTGVPCSHFAGLIDALERDPARGYVAAANEGEAVALAAGVHLGGGLAAVMMQNSGLGNAVNPLTSLTWPLGLPLLLLISWRGEPGLADEPQHQLMGAVTPALLDAMQIPHTVLPAPLDADAARAAVTDAVATALHRRGPVALLVRSGTFPKALPREPEPRTDADPPLRAEILAEVMALVGDRDLVVATTGYTARELESAHDRPGNVYVVGSMGCASSVALGLARSVPADRRVVVLDGDGAALMRLEAMATIGRLRPPNLLHLVVDNGSYESTGRQRSGATAVDLPAVARACGYPQVHAADTRAELAAVLRRVWDTPETRLVHVRSTPGAPAGLGRPRRHPRDQAARVRQECTRD